jgi:hypothetical protein
MLKSSDFTLVRVVDLIGLVLLILSNIPKDFVAYVLREPKIKS